MASTTLVREALRRASDQLFDLNPQFARWDQTTLVHFLSDGQRVIAKYLPSACARVDTIQLEVGTRQSIDTVPFARVQGAGGGGNFHGNRLVLAPIRNMGEDGLTPGRAVRVVDRIVLDQADPDWHTRSGKAVSQIVYDSQTPKIFYVSPGVPAGTSVWLEMAWLPDPQPIPLSGKDYSASGSDPELLSIDDKYLDDLVNYVIARAYLRDSEAPSSAALASAFSNLFVAGINSQAVAMGLPNPKLRSLPSPNGS